MEYQNFMKDKIMKVVDVYVDKGTIIKNTKGKTNIHIIALFEEEYVEYFHHSICAIEDYNGTIQLFNNGDLTSLEEIMKGE